LQPVPLDAVCHGHPASKGGMMEWDNDLTLEYETYRGSQVPRKIAAHMNRSAHGSQDGVCLREYPPGKCNYEAQICLDLRQVALLNAWLMRWLKETQESPADAASSKT